MDDNSVTNTHDQKLPSTRRKAEEDVSIEYLREAFRYEPETGLLFWSERPPKHFKNASAWRSWNDRYAGKVTGSKQTNGYLQIRFVFDGSAYRPLAHRVIWGLQTGAWPLLDIDHINHNKADNRWSNLRHVSTERNMRNLKKRSSNRSGVTGVTYDKLTEKWIVRNLELNGRESERSYPTKEEAILARNIWEAASGYHPNHGLDLENGERPMFPVRWAMNTDDYQLIVDVAE